MQTQGTTTPTGTPSSGVGGSGSWADAVETFLEDVSASLESVTTIEERLVLSVALFLAVVLLGRYVLPRLADAFDRWAIDRLSTGRVAEGVEVFSRYAPTTAGGVVLRSIQISLFVTVAAAVLVLWGFTDVLLWAWSEVTGQLSLIGRVLSTFVLAVLGYVGAGFLADLTEDFSKQTEWMTEHQEEIVLRVSQLGFFGFVGLLVMGVWDVNLGGLLVGAGFLGIVVGFAARQTLGSLIAGFVLMFSRPFTIGDWVQVGDQEGIVTDITIFNTRLENFDGEFVVIPNDTVSNQAITNRSQKGLLRVRVDVGIDYDADPDHARQVAIDTISDLKEVVDSPAPQAFPKAFGDSAVVLEMRFWIDHPRPPRKWKAISAVITSIKSAFAEEGIKIPYPQRELSGRAETGGFRVHDAPDEARAESPPEPRETD